MLIIQIFLLLTDKEAENTQQPGEKRRKGKQLTP